ncbi:hypothetical protein V8E55_002993 [Tylopilus felleus]
MFGTTGCLRRRWWLTQTNSMWLLGSVQILYMVSSLAVWHGVRRMMPTRSSSCDGRGHHRLLLHCIHIVQKRNAKLCLRK